MMGRVLVLLSFFITPLFAQTFDDMMNANERKMTGVYKLTYQEKQMLLQWIQEHYTPKKSVATDLPHETLNISENLYNGHYIRLSNNSLWKVRPSDIPVAQGWISPVQIRIDNSGDRMYPSQLINMQTGSSVAARRVSRLPQVKKSPPPLQNKTK